MHVQTKSYLVVQLLLFLFGCAQIRPVGGGPKDEDPPFLVSSNPYHTAVNVMPKRLDLYFNERIKLNNINSDLLISPYDKDLKFDARVSGKRVRVLFDSLLQQNTSYTFNFQETIGDVTENNKAQVVIAFSTGPILDSCEIGGKVTQWVSAEPVEGIKVILKEKTDTISLLSGKPDFVAYTDTGGNYQFYFLPSKTYRVYALDESNRNLIYDRDDETVGEHLYTINLKDSCFVENVDIRVSTYDTKAPKIEKVKLENNFAEIVLTEGIYSLLTVDSQPLTTDFYVDTISPRNLKLFPKTPIIDSTNYYLKLVDSSFNEFQDTLILYLPDTFELDTAPIPLINKQIELKFGQPLTVKTNARIRDTLFRNLFLIKDSMAVDTIVDNDIVFDVNRKSFSIPFENLNVKQDSIYAIGIPDSSIKDLRGNYNLNDTIILSNYDPTAYGSIYGKVIDPPSNYIVQLLDNTFKKVKERRNTQEYSFTGLEPGQYTLRLIVDINNNGIWDMGDYALRQLPEPVVNLGTMVKVKANWELTGVDILHTEETSQFLEE